MTAGQALHNFFSSFGLDAYVDTAVPDDVALPYLTYQNKVSDFLEATADIEVNLWYYTTSEATPNAKAKQIHDAIGMGGKLLSCDDGYIWVKRGTPWCQSLLDDTDKTVKRRYINVSLEYLTKG